MLSPVPCPLFPTSCKIGQLPFIPWDISRAKHLTRFHPQRRRSVWCACATKTTMQARCLHHKTTTQAGCLHYKTTSWRAADPWADRQSLSRVRNHLIRAAPKRPVAAKPTSFEVDRLAHKLLLPVHQSKNGRKAFEYVAAARPEDSRLRDSHFSLARHRHSRTIMPT